MKVIKPILIVRINLSRISKQGVDEVKLCIKESGIIDDYYVLYTNSGTSNNELSFEVHGGFFQETTVSGHDLKIVLERANKGRLGGDEAIRQ